MAVLAVMNCLNAEISVCEVPSRFGVGARGWAGLPVEQLVLLCEESRAPAPQQGVCCQV